MPSTERDGRDQPSAPGEDADQHPTVLRLEVEPQHAGERLDRFLAERLGQSRNRVQRWLGEGLVRVEGQSPRAAHRVATGERVEVTASPEPDTPAMAPEAGMLRILYEDADLVVVDKPAGLVVHPGAGRPSGTLAHRLLQRYPEIQAIGHPRRPGIVHRLDRDTSGALVVARSERAYRSLTADFASRGIGKLYLAIVWGSLGPLVLDQPIGRHVQDRKRMAVRSGGRAALSEVTPLGLAASGKVAAVAVRLHTGRTHQIRVHLQQAKHPLLGDPVYGEARWKPLPPALRAVARDFPRPALHAWVLVLRHPADGTLVRFESPVPADLLELWAELGGDVARLAPPEIGDL